jgi:adenylate kinase family enzyme
MASNLEKLEAVTRKWFHDWNSKECTIQTFKDATQCMIDEYRSCSKSIGIFDFSKINYETLFKIFQTIHDILNIKFDTFITIKEKGIWSQKLVSSTLYDYLCDVSNNHTHTVKIKEKTCVCDYHMESLFSHLMMCSLITYMQAQDDEQVLSYTIAALLHDIGKVGTARTNFDAKRDLSTGYMSYAFHGELGSGILKQAYNKEFGKYFDETQWLNICKIINVHMCGYHDIDQTKPSTQYKWSLLRHNNKIVKNGLYCISFGDHFSSIRDPIIEKKEDHKLYFDTRKLFASEINKDFNCSEFMQKHLFKNLIIMLRGRSASGKSTYAKTLMKYLDGNQIQYVYIDRDTTMIEVVCEHLKEKFNGKVDGDEYHRYYKVCKEKNLGARINQKMQSMIDSALQQRKIVIFDSITSLYSQFEQMNIFPPTAANAFIIAIDIVRNMLITEEDGKRLGINIKDQIDIFGSKTLINWMPDSSVNFKRLTARSTDNDVGKVRELTRPHLCYQFARNSDNIIGQDEVTHDLAVFMDVFKIQEQKEEKKEIIIDDTDIVNYCQYLLDTYKWEGMLQWFRAKNFTASTVWQFKDTPLENRVLRISYMDNCPYWSPSCLRQCRGVILYLNNNGKLEILKNQLQRGAEVLTSMHLKKGIDSTQDYNGKYIDKLDSIQKKVITKLANNSDIHGYLSMKKDGSLCCVSLYSGSKKVLFEQWIEQYGDDYAKAFMTLAKDQKLDFVPVVSSQTTLFIGEMMQAYTTTAILDGCGIVDYATIHHEVEQKMTPATVMLKYGAAFIKKLQNFYAAFIEENKSHEVINLNFETICRNRTSNWGDNHTELAVSYDKSSFTFLSMSYGTDHVNFTPHFMMGSLVNKLDLAEPLWWEVNHTKEIEAMFIGLTQVIWCNSTIEEYMAKFVPNNKNKFDKYLDYEGFVFYADVNGDGKLDYSKIKTEEYYKAHKFKHDNIDYLFKLAKVSGKNFPCSVAVLEFFGNLYENLKTISSKLNEELQKEHKESKLFAGLKPEAQTALLKKDKETQIRMLINASNNFLEFARDIFAKYFPSVLTSQTDMKDIISCFKSIFMNVKMWETEEIRIKNIRMMVDELHECLCNLFAIIMNQDHGN